MGLPEASLVELSERSWVAERTIELGDLPPDCLARQIEPRRERVFSPWRPASVALRVYEVRDAVLDGKTGVLIKDGRKTSECKYISEPAFDAVELNGEPITVDNLSTIIGYNMLSKNYFHWIGQCLPAIDLCQAHYGGLEQRVAVVNLSRFQRDSLAMLGLGNVVPLNVEDSRQYRLTRAVFSPVLSGAGSFVISQSARNTYRRMRERVTRDRRDRKLYVARTDAGSRKLGNEAEVISLLDRLGYEIVVPGALTVAEQARRFREASVVIGPHGAGLGNIVFCEPGTVVYELVPAHYQNACFCNLAAVAELDYIADAFQSSGEGLVNFRPWRLDFDLFQARVHEIERFLAPSAAFRRSSNEQEAPMSPSSSDATAIAPRPRTLENSKGERMEPLSELVLSALTRALAGQSELDTAVLGLSGMSGRKYRMFINNLMRSLPRARYLEIGAWAGSTLCAAISGCAVTATVIENWSQFGGPKSAFLENVSRFRTPDTRVTLIEDDYRRVNYADLGGFGVYLFDGPHGEQDSFDGLAMALPALDDEFVLIADDWNWPDVRRGIMRAIDHLGLATPYSIAIRTTFDDSHPAIAHEHSDWHNGYFIAVIQKPYRPKLKLLPSEPF